MNSTTISDPPIAVSSSTSHYRIEQRDNEWRLVVDWATGMDADRSFLLMRALPRLFHAEEVRLYGLTDGEVQRQVDYLKQIAELKPASE